MNMKKNLIALGAALMLGLSACGTDAPVNAEQAGMLTSAAVSSDKFAGVVINENVIQIDRDTDKKIEELYVAAGDEVRINEKLFEYDTDTLSLTIDKQELEMDKLDQQIKDLNAKIKELDSQIKKEKAKKEKEQDKDLLATLERDRQAANIDLTDVTYQKKSLQAEIDYNKDVLKNAVVRSPIKGTIRSINENGSPYITIQQDGSFQVKGTLNELSMNAGIMEGAAVTILSRTDATAFWTGTVSLVDYNSAGSNEYDDMFGNSDSMTSSTSYPFYVTLDSTDGLLLGQHVYIQLAAPVEEDMTLRIPENYIMDVAMDEESFLFTGSVWCVKMETQTLTKVTVTLGEYDPTYATYTILDGITAESYLADPADPGCKEGAAVTLRSATEYQGQTEPAGTEPDGTADPTGTVPSEETPDPEVPDEVPPEAANGDAIEDPVNNGV